MPAATPRRQQDELASIANERQEANRLQTEAAAQTADLKAQAATDAASALQVQQEQAARRQEVAKGEYARLQAIAKAEDDKYKNAGFRDFWADKSNGTKALAAISMALGTLGQGLAAAGGSNLPNTAMQLINQAIDRDWAIQKERIGKLKEVADASRQDAHGAQLAYAAAEANTIARQKDALAAAIDKAAAANGSSEIRAKGAAMSAQYRMEAVQDRQKGAQAQAQLANTRADTSLKYAEAGKMGAEAEAKRVEAAAGGKDASRAATTQIQKATLAEHGQSALDTIDKLSKAGVAISEKDRVKIQQNEQALERAKHWSLAEVTAGQASGLIPRSRFDGLDEKKQALANAYDILAQKGASLTSPSHDAREIESARERFDMLAPGQGSEILRQKIIYSRQQMGAARALAGKYSGIAQAGAEEGAARAPADKPQLTPQEKTTLVDFIRKNPNDPRAAQARQLLGY